MSAHPRVRRARGELGGAASAPRTRRSLRHRRLGCLLVVCLGVVLAAVAILLRVGEDDERLQSSGSQAAATVEAVRLTRAGGAGGASGSVDVAFVDATGATHHATINLGRIAPRYAPGQHVDIVYDAAAPTVVEVVGKPTDGAPVPWLILLLAGCVALFVGAATALRLRWTTRVLRRNPWVEVPATLLEVPVGGGSRHAITLVELRGAPDEGGVLAASAMWRARPMVDLTPAAWVAGSGRYFIVAAVGGAPLVRAKRVRLGEGHRRPPGPQEILPSRLHPAG